ncbi:beta-1,6-N-acetylglucosaminyltransferase, partial [uncultured Brachyspira sp.]|uniref:beta-1,6-N-acetylglucosaminyltransferase n=1 Tax=uncultured Brachyspira sp. TaxID=221953 RepID=UPI002631BFB3
VDKEFIEFVPINNSIYNYEYHYNRLVTYNFEGLSRKNLHSKLREFLSNLKIMKRKMIENAYYGSQWWNLTNNAVEYILNYVENNSDYLKRFKNVWGSDEYFFQTILLNSILKNNCLCNNLRYIDWSRAIGSHPHTFVFNDYNNIKLYTGGGIFARKFDENIDNDIIDKLYEDLED